MFLATRVDYTNNRALQGASILTGLGFNGYSKSGEVLWNRTANVDIMNIEFAPSFKVLLDSWNMNTNVWLRNSVYKRVTPKGKTAGLASVMITFLTSAFWVGVRLAIRSGLIMILMHVSAARSPCRILPYLLLG